MLPKQCAACHEKEVAQHQPSHHAKGGQILASLDNIMGEVIGGPAAVFCEPESDGPM